MNGAILIIEDEPLIALDIEQIVIDLGHRVSGIARTHSEAVDLYKKTSPGMILADIQLADGSSGIDAVNEILMELNVPVIFITAMSQPEDEARGFEAGAADFIHKPFNPATVLARCWPIPA